MKVSSLFKFKTVVAAVLSIQLTIPLAAFSNESEAKKESTVECPMNLKKEDGTCLLAPNEGGGNSCGKLRSKLTEAVAKFKEACNKTGISDKSKCNEPDTIIQCAQAKKKLNKRISNDDGEERVGSEYCDDIDQFVEQGCAGFLQDPKDASTSVREYKNELRHLQRDRDKAKKDADEKRQKLQDELNKLDEDAANADKEWQEKRQELAQRIQEETSRAEEGKTAANADTVKKMDEIDVEYIKLRDQIRRRSSNIAVMNATWSIQCRATAVAAERVAEEEFDRRMAEENKIIKNYAFTRAPRKLKNALKQRRRAVVSKYNETYTRCMNGEINPGAETRAKIIAAQTDQVDSGSLAQEQAQRLEKIKRESLESLQARLQSLETQKQQAILNITNQINALDQNQQINGNRLQQRKMLATQNLQTQMANADKELKNLDEEMVEFRRESLARSAWAQCSDRLPSADIMKSSREGHQALAPTHSTVVDLCEQLNKCNASDLPQICTDVLKATAGPVSNGKSAPAVLEDVRPQPTRPQTPAPAPAQPSSPGVVFEGNPSLES